GVNLLKGNYRDENNTFNWNRLGIDAATNFAIGGLTALYVGKQGTNIVKGLQNYAGPMGGNNLYNVAVRGAAEWVIISPAFTVGGGLWEGVKAKAGYYGNGLSADSQNLVNNMSWDPRTWVLIKGNYTEEEGKMKLNLASLTGTDLLLSAVEGPRSGMWMKPLISLAQVQTEQPGLIGRSLDKIGEKITAGPKAAFGKLSISHPGLAKALTYVQKGASWTYSSVIRMPGIVTAIDTGVGMIDDQMLKLANPGVALDDPKLYRQAEDSKGNIISGQFTRGYMSKGMREYAKWLPFFMMPVRIPKNPTSNKLSESGKDMSEALKVLGLKSGASADEMKLAYRDLARSMHPDVNPNNPLANAQMSEINGAYAFLTGKTNSFSRANYNTTAAPSKNTNFNGTYPISNAGETRIVVYDPVFARTQIELSQGRMPTIWQPQQVNVVQAAKTTSVQPAVSALPIVTKVSVSTSLTVYDPIFARTQIELSQGRIPTAWRMQNNVVSNQLNSLNQSIINGVNNLRNNPAAIPMFVTRGLKSFLAQEGLSGQEINGLSAEQAWARADGILTAKGVIEPIKSQPMQQQPAPLAQPTVTISTGVPVSSIGNVEINAAVKQAEINLGIARGESAFTARPEQRSTSTDILLNAVKGEDMMYTQSTSGGKTKVIIPMTETATVLLGGKAVRVVPTDTGLETLRTDPVMQKLAPDRIIISQEDMNLGLSQDPARFIASIENSNQIAISQTTLGFLENQASLGDVNSQRAVNALLHKDFKGMKVMIHDEAQYATPPTIIGEQPKSVKESHPAVYKVSKEVGTVIFSTLKLSEKDFASEIKDQSDNLHKTGDFEVRRFDAPVMDKIAKELIGPKATANSLSQDQLHAINTAAELIPTKRGTDHDYTVDKGIIEMTQGEDRSSTNPSDPYFAAMRQQLYLHRYGIEVADDLIVTSPRGNQVGYSRVLNDFRKAGWSIPGLTATPQARKAAWEYGISMDVKAAIVNSSKGFEALGISGDKVSVVQDVSDIAAFNLLAGHHVRIVPDAGVADYNLIIDQGLALSREIGADYVAVQEPGGTWVSYKKGQIELTSEGEIKRFSEQDMSDNLLKPSTPKTLIIHCSEGRANTDVARFGAGTEDIPTIGIIHPKTTAYDATQLLGRGNSKSLRRVIVIDPTKSFDANKIGETLSINTEQKLSRDAVSEIVKLVSETTVNNLEALEAQAKKDNNKDLAAYLKERRYDWQTAQKGEATPDIGSLQDVDNYILDSFNRANQFMRQTCSTIPLKGRSAEMQTLVNNSVKETPFENLVYKGEEGADAVAANTSSKGLGGLSNLGELFKNLKYHVNRGDLGAWVYPGYNADKVEAKVTTGIRGKSVLPHSPTQLVDRYFSKATSVERAALLEKIQNPDNGFVWRNNTQALTPAGRQLGSVVNGLRKTSASDRAALRTLGTPDAKFTTSQQALDVVLQWHKAGLTIDDSTLATLKEIGYLNLGLKSKKGSNFITVEELAKTPNVVSTKSLIDAVEGWNEAMAVSKSLKGVKKANKKLNKEAGKRDVSEIIRLMADNRLIQVGQNLANMLSKQLVTPIDIIRNNQTIPELSAYQPFIDAIARLQQKQARLNQTQGNGSWLSKMITGAQYTRAINNLTKQYSSVSLARIMELTEGTKSKFYAFSVPFGIQLDKAKQQKQFNDTASAVISSGLDKKITIQQIESSIKSTDTLEPITLLWKHSNGETFKGINQVLDKSKAVQENLGKLVENATLENYDDVKGQIKDKSTYADLSGLPLSKTTQDRLAENANNELKAKKKALKAAAKIAQDVVAAKVKDEQGEAPAVAVETPEVKSEQPAEAAEAKAAQETAQEIEVKGQKFNIVGDVTPEEINSLKAAVINGGLNGVNTIKIISGPENDVLYNRSNDTLYLNRMVLDS
ncbi:MAG: J domain-containing protein, partial [Candidatus Omnitrophota bacterium]